jgi:hypothetical protein
MNYKRWALDEGKSVVIFEKSKNLKIQIPKFQNLKFHLQIKFYEK